MQHLVQHGVRVDAHVPHGSVEAGDRTLVHVVVRTVAAVDPDHRGLVPEPLAVEGWAAQRLGPIRREAFGVIGMEPMAERVRDDVVRHDAGMPGLGQIEQARHAADGVEDGGHHASLEHACRPSNTDGIMGVMTDRPEPSVDADRFPGPVIAALDIWLAEHDRRAPGMIEGLYLVGSLALDDWRQGSDIDIVAVTSDPASPDDADVLRAAADAVRAVVDISIDGPILAWGDLSMPPLAVMRPWTLDGEFRFDGDCFEINPVTWYTLATHGVAVRGDAPDRLGIPLDDAERRQWVRDNVDTYWRGVRDQVAAVLAVAPGRDDFDAAMVEWCALGDRADVVHDDDGRRDIEVGRRPVGRRTLARPPRRLRPGRRHPERPGGRDRRSTIRGRARLGDEFRDRGDRRDRLIRRPVDQFGASSPTRPSMASLMRSAWPQWRAYSSIMSIRMRRRLGVPYPSK